MEVATTGLNQAPPLEGYNALDTFPALGEALQRHGAGWAEERVRGANKHFDRHLVSIRCQAPNCHEWDARRIVEDLGVALQASLLIRFSTPAVADALCANRLGRDEGHAYGTLPSTTDFEGILERAWPQ